MSVREDILERIRKNRPQGQYSLPAPPRFPLAQPDGLVHAFCKALTGMGGRAVLASEAGDPQAWIRTQFDAKVICSAASE